MMNLFLEILFRNFYTVHVHLFLKVTKEVLDFFQTQLNIFLAVNKSRNVDAQGSNHARGNVSISFIACETS